MSDKEKTTGIQIVKSSVKIGAVVKYGLSHEIIAHDLANIFEGKQPVSIVELFDEEGRCVFSDREIEDQLRRKGAAFVTIIVEKDLGDDMIQTHRETKEDNPFKDTKKGPKTNSATERYTIQGIVNVKDWQSIVDRRRRKVWGVETGWQANKKRANGIENFSEDSTVVCKKVLKSGETRFYINYLVLRYLTERTVTDSQGREIDMDYLDGFLKTPRETKRQAREMEAEKHGMESRFDPQIRQMKMSNIRELRIAGRVYIPTR